MSRWTRSSCTSRSQSWGDPKSSTRPGFSSFDISSASAGRSLKEIEVLVLLPGRGLVRPILDPVLLQVLPKPPRLVPLQLDEVVDEDLADLAAKERVPLERLERLHQARRQHRPVRLGRLEVLRARL